MEHALLRPDVHGILGLSAVADAVGLLQVVADVGIIAVGQSACQPRHLSPGKICDSHLALLEIVVGDAASEVWIVLEDQGDVVNSGVDVSLAIHVELLLPGVVHYLYGIYELGEVLDGALRLLGDDGLSHAGVCGCEVGHGEVRRHLVDRSVVAGIFVAESVLMQAHQVEGVA